MSENKKQNQKKGREFQKLAEDLLSNHFGISFQLDHPLDIGYPPKQHRYDLVSNDSLYVCECKNFSWTKSDNVPSAKMATVNEAVFLLSFLPSNTNTYIVLRRVYSHKRKESLAEYYYRTHKHILRSTRVLEIEKEPLEIREINQVKDIESTDRGITKQIDDLAVKIIKTHPHGIRITNLMDLISRKLPNANPNTISRRLYE